MNRRKFLVQASVATALLASPALAKNTKRLTLFRPRTGESVTAEFTRDRIGQKTYAKLNWLLRDVSAGHWKAMDTGLLVLAADLSEHLKLDVLHVQSGFRTAKTNASIRGAAKNSYHVKGQAMDIRAPGTSTAQIARLARSADAGGVGRYPKRGFVHIDTGPRRDWVK